jgi:hypothetical protein
MFRPFFVLCLLFSSFVKADEFANACAAYDAGKYPEALEKFEALAKNGLSAELAYNLGCTESKLSERVKKDELDTHSGKAILWFQRATILDPFHRESQQNLRFLTRREGSLAFDNEGIDELLKRLPLSIWKTLLWSSVWLLAISVVGLVVLRPRLKWPWISSISLFTILTALIVGCTYLRSQQISPAAISVVTQNKVIAKNAPAETADDVMALYPGTQVLHLQTRGNFTYVQAPGNLATRGWVPNETLEKLWPY